MKDIMLDLETMDTANTGAIVAIGAIEFDPFSGKLGQEFYRIVDLNSCIDVGMTLDSGTVYWWLQQSKAARDEIVTSNRVDITTALREFTSYCKSISNQELSRRDTYEDLRIWGNGASFDNAMLAQAYKFCKKKYPIDFWNDRDVRTLLGFFPPQMHKQWKDNNPRQGYHNALEDSKYQVKFSVNILKELGVTELF